MNKNSTYKKVVAIFLAAVMLLTTGGNVLALSGYNMDAEALGDSGNLGLSADRHEAMGLGASFLADGLWGNSPIKITSFEITNSGSGYSGQFYTAKTAMDDLHLELKISRAGFGDTASSVIALEFPGNDYFDWKSADFSGKNDLESLLDFDNVEFDADANLLTIPVLTADLNDATMRVDVPFKRDTYGGMLAPGTDMGTVKAYTMAKDETGEPDDEDKEEVEVVSYTKDANGWIFISQSPTGLIVPGSTKYQFVYTFGQSAQNSDWYYKEDSQIIVKIYVPLGTDLTSAIFYGSSGISAEVNNTPIDGQNICLHQDEDGYYYIWKVKAGHELLPADGWFVSAYLYPWVTFTFSDITTSEIQLRLVAEYELEGTEEIRKKEIIKTLEVSQHPDGLMTSDPFTYGGWSSIMAVNTQRWGSVSEQYRRVDNLAVNIGGGNLTNVKVTLENEDAVFSSITVLKTGTGYPYRYVATAGGVEYTGQIESASSSHVLGSIGGIQLKEFGVSYPLIDTIEFYPQVSDGNGGYMDALLPGAGMSVRFDFTGNLNPDTADGVVHSPKLTVNWDGQEAAETRSTQMPFRYVGDILDLQSTVKNVSTNLLTPGENATMRVTGTNAISGNYSSFEAVWERPTFFIIAPQELTWMKDQAPTLFWERTDNAVDGVAPGIITDTGKEYDGRKIYRIEFDCTSTPIPQTTTVSYRIYFDLDFLITPGTPQGTLRISDFAIATEGHPNPENYNIYDIQALDSAYIFDDSALDLDGNPQTSILRKAPNINLTIQESSAFTVYANLETESGVRKNTDGVYAALQLQGDVGIQLVAENTGNMEIENFRLYNILPHKDVDTDMAGNPIVGTLSQYAGSDWNGYFAGNLQVTVYDASGNNISGNYTPSISYSNDIDPYINAMGFERSGTGSFTASFDTEHNRAFYVALDKTLPAGARVVIDFRMSAPETYPAPQVDEEGYNTFVALGKYKGGSNLTPYCSTQEFRITHEAMGEISGTVYKAVDAAGTEEPWHHSGLVELYRDGVGGWTKVATTGTDVNGEYKFSGLFTGDYMLKFRSPAGYEDVQYKTPAGGESGTIALVYDPAGFGSEDNDAVATRQGTVIISFVHDGTEISAATLTGQALEARAVTVPADAAIPANYRLKDGEPNIKNAVMTWDAPVANVVYEVEPVKYKVTYDSNHSDTEGYTDANPAAVFVAHGGTVGTLPQPPTRTGYTFTGWTGNSNGTGGEFTAGTAITGTVTVYAQWELKEYKLRFDANGNGDAVTGVPAAPRTVQHGQSVGDLPGEGAMAEPEREGYLFRGWSRSYAATAGDFSGADSITEDTTIYAVWEPVEISITVRHYRYDWNQTAADAALADTENVTVYYSDDFTTQLNAYQGYTFQEDISDLIYHQKVTADMTITLYYRQNTPYRLQTVELLVLDCDDLYPSFVSNALDWEVFLELLEAKTLDPDGNVVNVAFKALSSADYGNLDYGTITLDGPVQQVTVTAEWEDGQTDSQTVRIRIVDRVRPVIQIPDEPIFRYHINGEHPMSETELLDDFAANGIYALDNYDGVTQLSVSYFDVAAFEEIDWSSTGEYVVFLDTVDQSGNKAFQREAVILVLLDENQEGGDKDKPVTPPDESGNGNSGGGKDKDSGSDKIDDLDGDNKSSTDNSGGKDKESTVQVGRDIYINDLDIPLANELLSIFEEDVPLAEINFFDIPDTGVKRSVAGLLAVGAMALAALVYKRED